MSEKCLFTLVHGHRIDDAIYEFPHRCPGNDCAIARWLADQQYRAGTERTQKQIDAWDARAHALSLS